MYIILITENAEKHCALLQPRLLSLKPISKGTSCPWRND